MPTSFDESSDPALSLSKWWLDRLGCVESFGFRESTGTGLKILLYQWCKCMNYFIERQTAQLSEQFRHCK